MHVHVINGVRFVHNGDYDGGICISAGDGPQWSQIEVSLDTLMEFVAGAIRSKLIQEIEQAETDALLERELLD